MSSQFSHSALLMFRGLRGVESSVSPALRGGGWVWLVSVCLLAIEPSPSQAQTQAAEDEYGSAVQAAVQSFNDAEFEAARVQFSRAHALKPSARTWRGLGACAFELGKYPEAVRELSFALEDTRSALTASMRAETTRMLQVARQRLVGPEVGTAPPAAKDGGTKPFRMEGDEPAAAPPPPAAAARGLSTQRILALIAGSVGVVGIGLGIGFGVHAITQGRERDRTCDGGYCTDVEGVRAADAAISAGNVSTLAWIVGGVGLGAGVVLWLTEPSEEKAATQLKIGPGSLQVRGRF